MCAAQRLISIMQAILSANPSLVGWQAPCLIPPEQLGARMLFGAVLPGLDMSQSSESMHRTLWSSKLNVILPARKLQRQKSESTV